MKFGDVLWGRVPAGLATLALIILGLTGDTDKPWSWAQPFHESRPWLEILILASFLVVHLIVSTWRSNQQSRRLAGSREAIQRNVLHLVSDLSGLAGKEYDLWMVDLYLARKVLTIRSRMPFLFATVLQRSLSAALKDVREVRSQIDSTDPLFGRSFVEAKIALWWDQDLALTQVAARNWAEELNPLSNEELRTNYGVIKIGPIVDELGGKCKGILVVHCGRDTESAMKGLGVLAQEEASRHLSRTCENIHAQLQK